jgi:hypothetical protein
MRGVLHGGARHTLDVSVTVRPLEELRAEARQAAQSAQSAQSQMQTQTQSQSQSQQDEDPL